MVRGWGGQLVAFVRGRPLVVVAVVVVVAFFAGLFVGGNPSGTAAEWAGGVGAFVAAVVALWIAGESSRERQRERRLQRALRFLTVTEEDWVKQQGTNLPFRSPEGIALAKVLRPLGLGQIAAGFYVEPQTLVPLIESRGGSANLTDQGTWDLIRQDALRLVENLS
jgi:hypothetical protein